MHPFCQLLGDRQPQTGTAVFSCYRRVGLGESFEDGCELVGRHTDSGVSDGKPNGAWCWMIRIVCHFNNDGALIGKLYRVANEVDQDLMQAVWITDQRTGNVGGPMTGQFQPLLVGP